MLRRRERDSRSEAVAEPSSQSRLERRTRRSRFSRAIGWSDGVRARHCLRRIASAPIDHKKKKRSSHTGRVRPPRQEVGCDRGYRLGARSARVTRLRSAVGAKSRQTTRMSSRSAMPRDALPRTRAPSVIIVPSLCSSSVWSWAGAFDEGAHHRRGARYPRGQRRPWASGRRRRLRGTAGGPDGLGEGLTARRSRGLPRAALRGGGCPASVRRSVAWASLCRDATGDASRLADDWCADLSGEIVSRLPLDEFWLRASDIVAWLDASPVASAIGLRAPQDSCERAAPPSPRRRRRC